MLRRGHLADSERKEKECRDKLVEESMKKGLTIKCKEIDFMVAFKNRYPKLLVT